MQNTSLICPNCGHGLTAFEQKGPPPRLPTNWIAIDRGQTFCCDACGESVIIWPRNALILKSCLALFCVWLGMHLIGLALFIMTIVIGAPALFGFENAYDPPEAAPIAAAIAAFGGALAFYAYPVDVARQIVLRWRLRRARKTADRQHKPS